MVSFMTASSRMCTPLLIAPWKWCHGKGEVPYVHTCFSGPSKAPVQPRRSAGGAAHTWWRLAWGATGRWWFPLLSAHLLCVAVANATLDPGLLRPETHYVTDKKKFELVTTVYMA